MSHFQIAETFRCYLVYFFIFFGVNAFTSIHYKANTNRVLTFSADCHIQTFKKRTTLDRSHRQHRCITRLAQSSEIINETDELNVPEEKKSLFVFGLGYVSSALAFKLLKEGWEVSGTTTDAIKAKKLQEEGINAFVFDEWSASVLEDNQKEPLISATHVLCSIPPSSLSGKDPVLLAHSRALEIAVHENKQCRWVGYLSSTGVYGDRSGQWVTEEDRPQPLTPKTRARRDAERAWQFLLERKDMPVHIFRLAGIYGPGRSALETLQKAGGDMARCNPDDQVFISRVHVSDIIQLLEASMLDPSPGLILNVADDQPSTRYEVLSYACRLMDLPVSHPASPPPAFDRWLERGSEKLTSRGGGSKRVDNSQMKRVLATWNKRLIHPDYRSGLELLAQKDISPFTKDQFELVSAPKPSQTQRLSQNTEKHGLPQSPGLQNEPQFDLNSDSRANLYATKEELMALERKVDYLANSMQSLSEKMELMLIELQKRPRTDFY